MTHHLFPELAIQECNNAFLVVSLFHGSLLNRHLMKSFASSLLSDQAGVRKSKCPLLIASKMSSSVSPLKGG